MPEFEEALEECALLKIGPSGLEKSKLISVSVFTMH